MTARGGPGQQEIGNVAAGDQQREAYDGHEREQRLLVLVADAHDRGAGPDGQRIHQVPREFVRSSAGWASLLDDLRLGGAKRCRGLLGRLPRREPEHHLEPAAVRSEVGSSMPDEWFRVERHCHIKGPTNFWSEKPRPRDADNRERDVVHADALANHVTTATEPPLPEPVADDRD